MISAAEALTWPRRNVITHAVGVSDEFVIDFQQGELMPGDIFVLSTDGLTAHVTDAEIEAAVVRQRLRQRAKISWKRCWRGRNRQCHHRAGEDRKRAQWTTAPTLICPSGGPRLMSADDKTRISPQVANTAVGTQLSGIYELDERIAFGGMGEVLPWPQHPDRDHVAIKIVLPEFARDQTILSLFRKEASILNHLSHDASCDTTSSRSIPGSAVPILPWNSSTASRCSTSCGVARCRRKRCASSAIALHPA